MNLAMRALWLIVLVFFVAGCSSAHLAAWPGSGDPLGTDSSTLPQVSTGNRVIVELQDGSVVRGRVVEITEDLLTLENSDHSDSYDVTAPIDLALTPQTIARDSVRTLKVEKIDGDKTALTVIGVGALVGGAIYFSMNFKPLGE